MKHINDGLYEVELLVVKAEDCLLHLCHVQQVVYHVLESAACMESTVDVPVDEVKHFVNLLILF
jgi:hypothetical protein